MWLFTGPFSPQNFILVKPSQVYPTEVLLFYCYHCTQKHITPKRLTSTDLFRTMLRSFSRPVRSRGMDFFSPKYGIRRLKALCLSDCFMTANYYIHLFQLRLLLRRMMHDPFFIARGAFIVASL